MKKLLLLLTLVASVSYIQAQKYVSSDSRQTCYWNSGISKFSECGSIETYESLFTLNADETMFVHTTPKIKSSYYVKSKTYSADNDIYTYEVVSDVGNKYSFLLGRNSKNFVILSTGHSDSKDDYIIKFPIKRQWTE